MKSFLILPSLLALAGSAYAGIDAYLTVTDSSTSATSNILVGSSPGAPTTALKTAVQLTSWNFDTAQTLNIGSQSTGAGAGKVTFNPFTFTKSVDANTPLIFGRLAAGLPSNLVTLTLYKNGGDARSAYNFMTVTFKLAAFKTQSIAGSSEDPQEVVSMEYGSMQITYWPQTASGAQGPKAETAWNRVNNRSGL